MKTIRTLITVLAVVIVATATAVEKPKMNVVPLTADRAIVSINNDKEALFELSIQADNGELVYYKQSTQPLTNYQKVFDFANLENGDYTMVLKINDTRLTKDFQVSSKKIEVGETKLRFDPYFAYAENQLKMSYLNFDGENYNLSIYGDKGLVFDTKLGKDFNLTTGYDLSRLSAGKYDVVLSSYDNEFTFSLEK